MVTKVLPSFKRLKFLGLFLVLIVLFFSGCEKMRNVKWVNYDETLCSDAWEFNPNNEKLKSNVEAYLKGKGFKVFEMEIFGDSAPSCSDCNCKTGRVIKCKIKKREVDDIKSQGFYE